MGWRMYNWFNDSILGFVSITRIALSILSDDGTQSELPWASPPLVRTAIDFPAPERFSKNFRESCRIGAPAAAMADPRSLSPAKTEIKRLKWGSQRLSGQSVCESGQITVVGLQRFRPSTLTDTPPFKDLPIEKWLSICISNEGVSPIKNFKKLKNRERAFLILEATFAPKRRPLSLIDRLIHQWACRSRTGWSFYWQFIHLLSNLKSLVRMGKVCSGSTKR